MKKIIRILGIITALFYVLTTPIVMFNGEGEIDIFYIYVFVMHLTIMIICCTKSVKNMLVVLPIALLDLGLCIRAVILYYDNIGTIMFELIMFIETICLLLTVYFNGEKKNELQTSKENR